MRRAGAHADSVLEFRQAKQKQMPFEAIAIANKLLDIAWEQEEALNPLKLQKLVYFANGWALALTEQPLIRERVEAWKYGPVVNDLYHALKEHGARDVSEAISVWRVASGLPPSRSTIHAVTPKLDNQGCSLEQQAYAEKLLKRIWTVYGKYSGVVLSNATHEPGSPWDITWKAANGAKHAVIPDDLIRDDFKRRLKKSSSAADTRGAGNG